MPAAIRYSLDGVPPYKETRVFIAIFDYYAAFKEDAVRILVAGSAWKGGGEGGWMNDAGFLTSSGIDSAAADERPPRDLQRERIGPRVRPPPPRWA